MQSRKLALGLAVLAAFMVVDSALAYYNPSTGRFLNRDPIGEPGFRAVQRVAAQTGFVPRNPITDQAATGVQVQLPDELISDTAATATLGPHLYAYVNNAPSDSVDPLGLCTCTVQVKASSKSGSSPGLHMYVYFKREGCGDDFTGAAHWGPCSFIGMCPKGHLNGKPYPAQAGNPGWGDDGKTPKGGPPPQTHKSDGCDPDPYTCLRSLMSAKYPTYLLLGPNSNSAAMEAARKCGVDTSGITGYPGQGISPGTPVSGG